jgi:pimeloyl-ACP methyl ester carboxylesterase
MGYSTFQENRTLLDWPKDLLALADHLAIPQFGVLGISGGGPYVLACLATIPADRLKLGAAVCGIYPLNLGARNMIFQSWILLWTGRWVPWLLQPMLEWLLGNAARDADNPNSFKEIIKAQLSNENLPQVDNDCLKSLLQNEATLSAYTDCIRESLRESARGTTHEAGIYGADWGFPLSQVDKSRLVIWHGVLDRNVPIDMADKAVDIIHPLVYNRVEGQGHASLPFGHREDILKSVTMQMVVEQ